MDFYPPLNVNSVFTNLSKNNSYLNIYNRSQMTTKPKTPDGQRLKQPTNNLKAGPENKMPSPTMTSNTSPKHTPSLTANSGSDELVFNRKLGSLEKTFHGPSKLSRCYIYRTVIVKSEIDLYANMDTVEAGIRAWKEHNPLLRSVVAKKPNENDNYFAFKSPSNSPNEFDNIKFLKYNSKNKLETGFDEIWKLLVEHETTLYSDDDSLLWRLTFFNIKHSESHKHYYAIILTYNHCIMDGRSSYNSILQLLAFIENIHTKKYKPEEHVTKTDILPSKEEIYKNRPSMVPEQFVGDVYLKTPAFFDKLKAQNSAYIPLKNLTADEEEKGVIYNHDNTPYITVKKLVEVSKTINSKFRTMVINQKDLAAVLALCKANGTKLTSFLNLVIIMALKLVYNKYGTDEETKKTPINFTVNVSLRETSEFKSLCQDSNQTLGCYVGLYFNRFTERLISFDDWRQHLWRHSKSESESFHKRIEKGQFLYPVTLLKVRQKNEFFYHFANSNIGVVQPSLTENKLIRVKQSFTTARYSKDNTFCWFTNLLATINNQLFWTISFNAHYVSQDYISLIIRNISRIIKELIKK